MAASTSDTKDSASSLSAKAGASKVACMMQKALASATVDLRYSGLHSTTGIVHRYANPGVTITAPDSVSDSASASSSASARNISYEFDFPVRAAESHNFLPLCAQARSLVPYYLAKYPQIMTAHPEWKADISAILDTVKAGLGMADTYGIRTALNCLIVLPAGCGFTFCQPVSAVQNSQSNSKEAVQSNSKEESTKVVQNLGHEPKKEEANESSLLFGQLIIQLPSQYASDDSGSASYDSERTPLGFVPQRYALQFAASYAGVQHQFGPVRSGIQVLLTYDLIAYRKMDGIKRDPVVSDMTDLILYPRHGSVAPSTTALLSALGQWLDSPDETTHVIYSAGSDVEDEVALIMDALSGANYWASQLPQQTVRALKSVSMPHALAELIVEYIPSDMQKGFFSYETTSELPKLTTGKEKKHDLKFTDWDKSDLPFVPTSIQVSSSFEECLDATTVGRAVNFSYWSGDDLIVIMPADRIVHMMAKTSLSGMVLHVTQMVKRNFYFNTRIPNLLLQLFRVNLPSDLWNVLFEDLRHILTADDKIFNESKRVDAVQCLLQNLACRRPLNRLDEFHGQLVHFLFQVLPDIRSVCAVMTQHILYCETRGWEHSDVHLTYLAQLVCCIVYYDTPHITAASEPFVNPALIELRHEFVRHLRPRWNADQLVTVCGDLALLHDTEALEMVQKARRLYESPVLDIKDGHPSAPFCHSIEVMGIDPDSKEEGGGKRRLEGDVTEGDMAAEGDGVAEGSGGKSKEPVNKRAKTKQSK